MKKIKILFQGDSITDAGRDKRNYHHMGNGYPKYASALIAENNPDVEFEFINFGISGNRTSQLFDRLYTDAIAFEPDIISILIGINDIWHRYGGGKIATTDAQIELNYRSILERLRRETNAKIIILEQFLIPVADKEFFRVDLDPKIQVTRKLAREFADAFIPLDGILASHCIGENPTAWAADGVHPTEAGARLIAGYYADAFDKLFGAMK